MSEKEKTNVPPNLEKIAELLEDETNMLTLDDTIEFKCRGCGKCCIETTDIILSPVDIYNLSKQLKMPSADVLKQYGNLIQGGSTGMPLILLKRDKFNRCLLLKDKKCMVHEGKPVACYLYPLGRAVVKDPDDETKSSMKYFMQKDLCNKHKLKTIKVRDYIGEKYIAQEQVGVDWLNRYGELSSNIIGPFKEFIENVKPYVRDVVLSCIVETLYVGLEDIKEDNLREELNNRYDTVEVLLKESKKVADYYAGMDFTNEEVLTKLGDMAMEEFLSELIDLAKKYKRH